MQTIYALSLITQFQCSDIQSHHDSLLAVRMLYIGDVSIVGGMSVSMNTLTCISTGGPATTVTWTRDSIVVTEGAQTVLDDPITGQYTHTLTVTGRQGGLYTCTVANNKPSSASASITVQGWVYVPTKYDSLIIIEFF